MDRERTRDDAANIIGGRHEHEGWTVARDGRGQFQIQRLDVANEDDATFASDQEAFEYVQGRADDGNDYAQALALVGATYTRPRERFSR